MQERRIDDYWNIDGSRNLSDPWTGFTQFTLLEEKPPNGYMWSGRRLTRQQLTSRPDHLGPELWIKLGRNAKLSGVQKSVQNAWRKLEVPMPAAMPCKIRRRKDKETCRDPDTPKTKYACIVEADESTKQRLEGTLHKDHEDPITGRGMNSLSRYTLVRKFIPMLQAMKYQMRKQQWIKNGKLEKIRAWQLTKVRNKKWGGRWSKERKQNRALRVVNGHLWPQEVGVGTDISKI